MTIPPLESYVGRKHLGVESKVYTRQNDPFASYYTLLDSIEDVPVNRMFGYPDLIQGDVFVEAEDIVRQEENIHAFTLYDDDTSGIADWLLLLQVDSDDAGGFMWGDVGRLYWCIKRDDLLAKDFEKAVCTMQCS